jgi:hypothetical protein
MKPDLDAIEARVNNTSCSNWGDVYPTKDGEIAIWSADSERNSNGSEATKADMVFMINARQDVPDIIAYARELEARVEKLNKEATLISPVINALNNHFSGIHFNDLAPNNSLVLAYRKWINS